MENYHPNILKTPTKFSLLFITAYESLVCFYTFQFNGLNKLPAHELHLYLITL